MEINLFDIVQQILNVVVLYIIVSNLLYKPVRSFMLKREESINQQLEQARASVKEADAMHKEYSETLANAGQQTRKILENRTVEADRAYKEITEKAERQALEILDNAQLHAVQYKKECMREMQKDVTAMAVEIASRILEREVNEQDNKEVIDEFFDEITNSGRYGWTSDGRA